MLLYVEECLTMGPDLDADHMVEQLLGPHAVHRSVRW